MKKVLFLCLHLLAIDVAGMAQSLPSSFSVEAKQTGYYNNKTGKFEGITDIDRQIIVKSGETLFIEHEEFKIINGPQETEDNVISYAVVGSEKVDNILMGINFVFDEYQRLTFIFYFGIGDDDTGYSVVYSKLKLKSNTVRHHGKN
jgi:hypothetical protein